jgi:hypothetical protein
VMHVSHTGACSSTWLRTGILFHVFLAP